MAAFRSVVLNDPVAPTNTTVIDRPAGVVDGDVLVASIRATNFGFGVGVITDPAGWTLIREDSIIDGVNGVDTKLRTLIRVANAEPATYTWSVPAGQTIWGSVLAYSGVDNVTPQDVAAVGTAVDSGAAPGTAQSPAITTVTDHALVLSTSSGTGGGGPAGMNNREMTANNSGGTSDFDKSPAGTYTPAVWLSNGAAWAAQTIALRPGAGAAIAAVGQAFGAPVGLLPGPWLAAAPLPEYLGDTSVAANTLVPGADTAALVDAVAQLLVLVAIGDNATALEAATLLVLVTTGDVLAATENSSTLAMLWASDAIAATEAVASLLALITGSDTATATEAAAVIVSVAQNDAVAAVDVVASLLVTLPLGDNATATEASAILAMLTGADTLTATEGGVVTILVQIVAADTVTASEGTAVQAQLAAADVVGAADATIAGLATLLVDEPLAAADAVYSLDAGAGSVPITGADFLTVTDAVVSIVGAGAEDILDLHGDFPRHDLPARIRMAADRLRATERAWVDVVGVALAAADVVRAREAAGIRRTQPADVAALLLLVDDEFGA